jgi:hypothetical protein
MVIKETTFQVIKPGSPRPLESFDFGNDHYQYIRDPKLSDDIVVFKHWTGGASCCYVITAYQTKPTFKQILKHENDHFKADSFIVGKDTIELYDGKVRDYGDNYRVHANLVYKPILFDLRNERWIPVAPNTGDKE